MLPNIRTPSNSKAPRHPPSGSFAQTRGAPRKESVRFDTRYHFGENERQRVTRQHLKARQFT